MPKQTKADLEKEVVRLNAACSDSNKRYRELSASYDEFIREHGKFVDKTVKLEERGGLALNLLKKNEKESVFLAIAVLEDLSLLDCIKTVLGDKPASEDRPVLEFNEDSVETSTIAAKQYDIWLMNVGPQKITVIKIIKEHLHNGLKEARALSEAKPGTVIASLSYNEARCMYADLKAAGAFVELEEQ